MSAEKWWVNYPWRMVQTNLCEIDMEDIDAVKFVQELKDFNATLVTFNAAGIIASYETKLPFQNKSNYLHGDSLDRILKECHKAGIKVIARCDFSKIGKNIFEEHPDWAYRQTNGEELEYNGYVQTCINGEYQQKYIYDILKELFDEYDFDGLYCNMSSTFVVDYELKVHEPCHCDTCKKMFKEQFDMDIPDQVNPRDPAFGKYMMFIGKCSAMQKQKMQKVVKSINENIAINGFDYFRTECNQDVNHHAWLYDASANSRRIAGPDRTKVVDDASAVYMAFQYRHSCISSNLLEVRQWQNLAYSNSTSMYILGTIGKHKDKSGLVASKKAFDFFAKHEDTYQGLVSKAEVLLVEKKLMGRNDPEVDGLVQALTEMHVPFDEMKVEELTPEKLSRYKALVLADVSTVSDDQAKMIDEYVKAGGKIIATGESGCANERRMPRQKMAFESLGVTDITERRKTKSSTFQFKESDCAVFKNCAAKGIDDIVPWDKLLVANVKEDAKKYMELAPEQPFGPPEICYTTDKTDIPAVTAYKYGEGLGVYVPFNIGTFYFEFGYENSYEFFKDVVTEVAGVESIAPNVTPMCEIVLTGKTEDDGETKVIQLINQTGCFGNNRFCEPIPLENLEIRIDVPKGAKVTTLNGGVISCEENKIMLDRLDSFEAIKVH
ncbi:MAG: beta-galactosidase trimerization domain-containing protein [Lachnospiraceae bacterium]|nr:beta-galactosidase trimerization domain-containing protein [Lachnospiraceae bacterium]